MTPDYLNSEIQAHTDNRGIVRNHNGLPAYCWFVNKYCLIPYCFQCPSFQEPVYKPRPKYDVQLSDFLYFSANPDALAMMGRATKRWYRKYKRMKEREVVCVNIDIKLIEAI